MGDLYISTVLRLERRLRSRVHSREPRQGRRSQHHRVQLPRMEHRLHGFHLRGPAAGGRLHHQQPRSLPVRGREQRLLTRGGGEQRTARKVPSAAAEPAETEENCGDKGLPELTLATTPAARGLLGQFRSTCQGAT